MGKIIIGLTDHTQKEDPKMEEQEEQEKKESTVLPEDHGEKSQDRQST